MTHVTKRQQKRISDAVKWTERFSRGDARNPRFHIRDISAQPILCVASGAIGQNSMGTCNRVSGTVSSGGSAAAGVVSVYNIGPAIASGTKLLAHWPSFQIIGVPDGTRIVSTGQTSTTPPPESLPIEWQYFTDVETLYLGGISDAGSATPKPLGSTPITPNTTDSNHLLVEFAQEEAGNADLVHILPGFSDAKTGNLVFQQTGHYLMLAKMRSQWWQDSPGSTTYPDPPQLMAAELDIAIGDNTPAFDHVELIASKEITTTDSVFAGSQASIQLFDVQGWKHFEHDGTNDRLTLYTIVGQITPNDLGFQPLDFELLVVRLPETLPF